MASLQVKKCHNDNPNEIHIFAEQTSQIYGSYRAALMVTIIIAPTLVFSLWPVIDHGILLIWLAEIMLLSLIRGIITYRYNAATPPPEEARLWYRWFLVGSFLSALVWGSSSVLLFPVNDFARQVFLAFVLGGMAAGAVTSLAYMKLPFYFFICLTLIPLQIQFFLGNEEMGATMGSMITLYFIVLIMSANRTHNNIKQNIYLHINSIEREQALQQSEHRYKTLLETATDAFFLHDLEGNFLDVNQQACRDLGYTQEALLQMSISDIKVDYDPKEFPQLWVNLKRTENIQIESLYRRKDGTTFPVEVSLGIIQVGNEKLFSTLVRDVTERKQYEAALLAAKKAAEFSNRSKTEFLANMSHELRTPLNGIIGFSQIMENQMFGEMGNERYVEYAHDIHGAGRHLLDIINDIMDISRIESGDIEFNATQINLRDTVEICVRMLEDRAQIARTPISVEISPDIPEIMADETRLKQIFLNLLFNSVKFTHAGKITVSAKREEDSIIVQVTDTGEGIPKEDIHLVLKPFGQSRHSSRIAHEGVGLGLHLAKTFMEMHGGKLKLQSEVAKGTTVSLYFPTSLICSHDLPLNAVIST